MKIHATCPCCNEVLIITLHTNSIKIHHKLDSSNDIEKIEILKKLNIEFG